MSPLLIRRSDQRIAQDTLSLTTLLGATLADIIILPLAILYYTYCLADIMSFSGPLSVFCYFLLGLVGNKMLMAPLMATTLKKV